jgi:hypothetical protein
MSLEDVYYQDKPLPCERDVVAVAKAQWQQQQEIEQLKEKLGRLEYEKQLDAFYLEHLAKSILDPHIYLNAKWEFKELGYVKDMRDTPDSIPAYEVYRTLTWLHRCGYGDYMKKLMREAIKIANKIKKEKSSK